MVLLPRPWLPLPGREKLLVQVEFSTSTYSVRLTDLQRIWSEDMSLAGIRERAKALECPIDASVDLASLLRNLEDALTVPSGPVTRHLEETPREVVLSITQPIGDTQLAWTFHLTGLGPEASAELALSLFSMVTWYQASTSDLFQVIQEKDRVIRQMSELCKSANVTYRPPRNKKAAFAFDRAEWCTHQRAHYQPDRTTLAVVRRVGENAIIEEYKEDWPTVLQNATKWTFDVLTSDSASSDRLSRHPKPTSRVKQVVRSKRQNVNGGGGGGGGEASTTTRHPPSSVGTPKRGAPANPISPVPLYKLKDNRESQELEEDLTLSDATTEASDAALEERSENTVDGYTASSKVLNQSDKLLRNTGPANYAVDRDRSSLGKDANGHDDGEGDGNGNRGDSVDTDVKTYGSDETEDERDEDERGETLDAPFLPSSQSVKSTVTPSTSQHLNYTDAQNAGTGSSRVNRDERDENDDDDNDDEATRHTVKSSDNKPTGSLVEPETPRKSRVLNLISPRKKRESLQARMTVDAKAGGNRIGSDDDNCRASASASPATRADGSGDRDTPGSVESNGTIKTGDRPLTETDMLVDEEEARRIKVLQKRKEMERKIATAPPKKARRF